MPKDGVRKTLENGAEVHIFSTKEVDISRFKRLYAEGLNKAIKEYKTWEQAQVNRRKDWVKYFN